MVNPIPEGYPRVTPYLIVDGAAEAIDFYISVLGATERMRMAAPTARSGTPSSNFGDSVIMLADEHPEMDAVGPKTVGGTPVSMHVYVEDADGAFERAIDGRREVAAPVEDQFYGDRSGSSRTRSATAGTSPRTSRTFRRRRWRSGPRRRWPAAEARRWSLFRRSCRFEGLRTARGSPPGGSPDRV